MVGEAARGVLADVQGGGDLGDDGAVGELEPAGGGCPAHGRVAAVDEVGLQEHGQVDGSCQQHGAPGVQRRDAGLEVGKLVEHAVQVGQARRRRRCRGARCTACRRGLVA
ncbi:hypothetical protein [Isoptericola sp. NPDC055881]